MDSPADVCKLPRISDDTITASLAARARADAHYSYIGPRHLVILNPNRTLANLNEASAKAYSQEFTQPEREQPHIYQLATRSYKALCGTSKSQAVVFSGLSASGKSFARNLFTNQILRLATDSKQSNKHAELYKASTTILNSFITAKTRSNQFASRSIQFTELHFSSPTSPDNAANEPSARPSLIGAKILTLGLDKARLQKLEKDERTYQIFYQLLAGCTSKERDSLFLHNTATEYRLLESSGCLRLQGGPGSDDSIAMDDLRSAFATLGFKQKNLDAVYRILSAILLLGNIDFEDSAGPNSLSEAATIASSSHGTLSNAATLLGLSSETLAHTLTNRTTYMRKEVCTFLLTASTACDQRDSLITALYSMLTSYIIETVNHRMYPGDDAITRSQEDGGASILTLDLPGFSSRTPALSESRRSTLMQNWENERYDQFWINYSNELVQHWVNHHVFDEEDGLPARYKLDNIHYENVSHVDQAGLTCEILRGGLVGSKADTKPGGIVGGMSKTVTNYRKGKLATAAAADASLMEGMMERFVSHTRFVGRPFGPNSQTSIFAINHFAGQTCYDVAGFIDHDNDVIDPEFVRSLKNSQDPIVAKLFCGPSLALETHPTDGISVVAAQVCSEPLRKPAPVKISSKQSTTTPSRKAVELEINPVLSQINSSLSNILSIFDQIPTWLVTCIAPNQQSSINVIDQKYMASQVQAYSLTDQALMAKSGYAIDMSFSSFLSRYKLAGEGAETVKQAALERDWQEGRDFSVGRNSIWLSYPTWANAENERYRSIGYSGRQTLAPPKLGEALPIQRSDSAMTGRWTDDEAPHVLPYTSEDSHEDLLETKGYYDSALSPPVPGYASRQHGSSNSISAGSTNFGHQSEIWGSEWKEAMPSPTAASPLNKDSFGVGEKSAAPGQKGDTVETVPTTRARRIWVGFVTLMTWWIPSYLLSRVGRMKRPDVRMAWREKVALCFIIFFICGLMLFLILGLGHILCPQFNKAWNANELGYHRGENDNWVAVAGQVYDITNFYQAQHSDIVGQDVTSDDMLELAGQDLTKYFPVPLNLGCAGFVNDPTLTLQYANFTPVVTTAIHTSGQLQSVPTTALKNQDWYPNEFLPAMRPFHKGPLVFSRKDIQKQWSDNRAYWAVIDKQVYDLSDYIYTAKQMQGVNAYSFLPDQVTSLFQQTPGKDITNALNAIPASDLNSTARSATMACLNNNFFIGTVDFRLEARCQLQSYLLLGLAIILFATIGAKFLAALQLGSKRMPELREKFVIVQVPCYTEGEESLRKTIDSIAGLMYKDTHKLLFIICDGMIVGSGNDRPTPRIVLDILGATNQDPEPLLFKSLGQGGKQLNYGKVYSGLYEFSGQILPYVVVVKVGRPTERSRPGNRGKRDSQILLMRFLNRVHFDSEMAPLELEIYHQIKNVIGVDPALYEFLLCVDADTEVMPDSLNRLVAVASDDEKIVGLCGETKLSNENDSIWTMIQVYEYYISHHLAKAFESLFGTVTCLPGCFCMYRIRTADKGRPLIISNLIIDAYAENDVDTLHKKNLLELGEDRYLTTLILKHFPHFKTKFSSDARAMTTAPETWEVLLSQRRRWINSTIHNLIELVGLKDLCGFCCFSMRLIVFIDLLGTVMLPATTVYLIYLIVTVASGAGAIPVISIVMIAAVYGLQVIIFLLKRQWQFIGWLIIYLLAYPVYSFFLPCYSFWHFDDFSWGSTRLVVGEGKNRKVLAGAEDDRFDESMIPYCKFSAYQEEVWEKGSQHTKAESVAGFSMATPRGLIHAKNASRATLASFMPPQPGRYSPAHGRSPSRAFSQAGSNLMGPFTPPFAQGYQSRAASVAGSDGGFGMARSASGLSHFNMMQPGSRRESSYSLGFSSPMQQGYSSQSSFANPFADPANHYSQSSNPSDEELVVALRTYLGAQDLLQVTKRSTRDALATMFPNADLGPRKSFINSSIDSILQGQV